MLRVSILAAELEVEFLSIACTALLKQVTETCCCLGVEEVACFLERCKRIGIKYRRPCVAVITSLVAGGEDVVVERRTIANDDFVNHSHLLEALLLESVDIKTFRCGQFMEIHIEDRSREEFGRHEALVELTGSIDLGDEFVGDHLTCLIVESVGLENLGLVSVVLHEL